MLVWVPELIESLGILVMLAVGVAYLQPLSENLKQRTTREIFTGVLFGTVIIAVMLSPITLPNGAVLDPRAGPAILAGVFGGPIAAVIAAVMGGFVRYFVIGGPVALGGASSFLFYGILGIAAAQVIQRQKIELTVLNLAILGGIGVISVTPAFFIGNTPAVAIEIFKSAIGLVAINGVVSVVVVGLAINRVQEFAGLRRELREKQKEDAKLSLVARETTNAVIIADRNGVTEWVNEGFERMTGYKAEEIIGKRPGSLLRGPDTNPETVRIMREGIENGTGFEVEVTNLRKDGTPFWVTINCQPVEDLGRTTKFIAVETDITERKAAEDALARQLSETEKARSQIEMQAAELRSLAVRESALRGRAEVGERAKSEFLATMSHEIRTPMTGVMGFADMLLKDELKPESADKVRQIKVATNSLLRIINDILDVSKLDAGRVEIEELEFNPGALAESVIEMFRQTCPPEKLNQLDIALDIQPGFPMAIKSDPTRLRQILVNLVGNAVKFTASGTVKLSCHTDVSDGKPIMAFGISDTGIGMEEETLSTIFQSFTQADATINRKFQGTGLGLSICKRLVDLLGGEIKAESTFGSGSVFSFWVPYEPSDGQNLVKPPVAEFTQEPTTVNLRILVAEDNDINRTIIRAMVEGYGHSVNFAEDGAEAVQKFKDGEFDLILMDIRMPVMSGVDAAREIRALESPKGDVPIIALTADVMEKSRDEYLDVGMNDVVSKPIDTDRLQRAINACVINNDTGEASSETDSQDKGIAPSDINLSEIQARLGLDEGIVMSLLQQFVDNFADVEGRLRDQIANVDAEAAFEITHELKGVAGSLGLEEVQRLSGELCEHFRGGEHLGVDDTVTELGMALSDSRGKILKLLPN